MQYERVGRWTCVHIWSNGRVHHFCQEPFLSSFSSSLFLGCRWMRAQVQTNRPQLSHCLDEMLIFIFFYFSFLYTSVNAWNFTYCPGELSTEPPTLFHSYLSLGITAPIVLFLRSIYWPRPNREPSGIFCFCFYTEKGRADASNKADFLQVCSFFGWFSFLKSRLFFGSHQVGD